MWLFINRQPPCQCWLWIKGIINTGYRLHDSCPKNKAIIDLWFRLGSWLFWEWRAQCWFHDWICKFYLILECAFGCGVTLLVERLQRDGTDHPRSCWVFKTTRKLVSCSWFMLSGRSYCFYTVDMWSVGCIFAEMLGGRPLFKGRDCKFGSNTSVLSRLIF